MNNTRPTPSLDTIETLCGTALRALYEECLGNRPPTHSSADFLRSNIAWALQARAAKKTPHILRQALLKMINSADPHQGPPCKTGTRLIREWQGQTHEVTILDKGYLWQGEHYRSLSRIALEITGARWSGPRFFGLIETSK
jgi:hypothetical protein